MNDSPLKYLTSLNAALDAHAIVSITDPQGRITYANDKFCSISKYARGELIGQDHRIVNSGLHSKEFFREMWSTIGRGGNWKGEMRNRAKDGSHYWVDTTIVPFLDDNGRITQYVSIRIDITQRHAAMERLGLFRSLVDASNDSFEVVDPRSGRFVDVNEKGHSSLGYSREEFLSLRVFEVDSNVQEANWTKFVDNIRLAGSMRLDEVRRRKDGSTFPVEVSVKYVSLDREYLVAVTRDISERKELEAKFFRAQRLEAIGSLASGIAHDMNNILAPILMSAPILRMGLSPEKTEQILTTIETNAQRGADLIRQLLAFGRGIEGDRRAIQARPIVHEIVKIAQQTFPKNISVAEDIKDPIWVIIGDPTQVHQVLLNLCVNARDAMPTGGVLTVAAKNVTLDEGEARRTPGAKPGSYVLLSVSDTGTGIAPEIVDQIFDPFFTTKKADKGTGLGLSTVLGIVKSHGGFIGLKSEIGLGSAFQVYFPAIPESTSKPVAEVAADLPRGRGELILLVDDEQAVRELTRDILVKFGYQVTVASDGVEAVKEYALKKGMIRAVITDLDMPLMDGITLVRVLRKLEPSADIIISSGIASEAKMKERRSELDLLGIRKSLDKPYTVDAILVAIDQVLSAQKGRARTPSGGSDAMKA